ncbi:MAG: amino acid permease [Alphaproteobacteria bacterium]|nr:amino acid permease [Alphaproteobacteria bacterium]
MAGVIEDPVAEQHEVHDLNPTLGVLHLIALGIGAIIGAGIFVITGHAAATYAGPAVVFSFAIAGLGCLFAGLCYAEFAAMIPVAGSAYTYTLATMGRFMAWFIGWNLVLEYLAAASTVAAGWSGYFERFMAYLGHPIPVALASAPLCVPTDVHCPTYNAGYSALEALSHIGMTGTYFNLPAVGLIIFISLVLIVGVHLSANFNILMVSIKLAIVLLVIAAGLPHVVAANHTPFVVPNTGEWGQFGWSGVLRATGVIFFAYIGFDAVSVAAQEAKNPKRDVPIGILGSLLICTVLYMLMSYVLTGLASYKTLNVTYPVSEAVAAIPATAWLAQIVNVGAIVGLASVVLVLLLGQSRIFYAMSKDGMIPPLFGQVHTRFRTPWKSTIITGIFAAVLAGCLPLDILGELVSIGTLLAFVIVCLGVMVLRFTKPRALRPFRTPYVWIVAPLGMIMCGAMMAWLPLDTWLRLIGWTIIGLLIFAFYGRRHAKAARWTIKETPAE